MKVKFHAEKAFFKTDTIDPFTGLPVYVFDSNFLPALDDVNFNKQAFDLLIVKAFKKIIARIPKHPYVLTCFTSGFKNFNNSNNSWITCLKCYQLLPDQLKSHLKKVYIVHESWLVRSLIQVLQNVLRIGFFKTNSLHGERYDRLIYCNNLTELSKHIDITKIRISLDVYLYDSQIDEKLVIPYFSKHDSTDYIRYKELIFDRITTRLLIESGDYDLVFTKPGNQKKLSILNDAIDRGNYLDVSQWDIYVMGSLYLSILRNEFPVLIPIDLISLPISDDYNYTVKTFQKITRENDQLDVISKLFEILSTLLRNSDKTKHDIRTLSKSITPTLCQEKISLKNSDRIAIGQRFIKNLLESWDNIIRDLTTTKQTPQLPAPRKVAFHKRTPSLQREPKALPEAPIPTTNTKRHVSSSSTISISSEFSQSSDENLIVEDIELTPPPTTELSQPSAKPILEQAAPTQTEPMHWRDESKVLADVTESLNKRSHPALIAKKKPNKVVTKFSDGYSAIEGQKKVNQLAKLYEERLIGLQIMKDIDS